MSKWVEWKRNKQGELSAAKADAKYNGWKVELEEAEARIRELKAEIEALKSDLSSYMDAANAYVNELHGVHTGTHLIVLASDWELYRGFHDGVCKTGTHVVVPVEPTAEMVDAGVGDVGAIEPIDLRFAYRAMIKAAQEGDK